MMEEAERVEGIPTTAPRPLRPLAGDPEPGGIESALRRSEAEHRALLEASQAILAALDRESLFEALEASMKRILDFDQALLTLVCDRPGWLRVVNLGGRILEPSLRSHVARENTHVGWVLENRRFLVRRDLRTEAEFPTERKILDHGLLATMVVPLVTDGEAIGTLNVGSRIPGRYTPDDARFLVRMAGMAAVAVRNVEAYERIEELTRRLEEENDYLQEEIGLLDDLDGFVGESEPMRAVKRAIETVAPTDATVLITGETGTGKELVARAIHERSSRAGGPFIRVNCAALPASLIESELFGHEKGAFTGAVSARPGRFELADGGTLFLDEVGELPSELQPKLLRVLQAGEFERVGSSRSRASDVRVVAATHNDLLRRIEEGRFREDLYYRLAVFPIDVPPLRDRTSDIPLLVRHFVARFAPRIGRSIERIPEGAMRRLSTYRWPGNVRELENVIERAVILSRGSELELRSALPARRSEPEADVHTLEDVQRRHIVRTLESVGWKVSGPGGAAELLEIKPTTLESRMKRLGIERPG